MVPYYSQTDFELKQTLRLPNPGGWTPENSLRVFLRFGDEETRPISFRLFGYERYTPGKRVVRSARPYIVRYVIGGRGHFNGQPIERGCCYMSVPGQKYTIESDAEDPLIHYWFELLGNKAPLYVERLFGSTQPGVIRLSCMDECESIFCDLLFHDQSKRKLSTYIYSAFFHLLALHQSEKEEDAVISKPMAMYLEAVDYIDSHLNRQIKVTDLCDRLHIVPDYLYKIFRRYSGLSTQEYIIKSKMNMAGSLLADPAYSIADIADMVGYPDQGQFTKAFRRIHGHSPSEFRRSKLKQHD